MSWDDLVIDDEYINSVSSFCYGIGANKVHNMIKEYKEILCEIGDTAILDGELSEKLNIYIAMVRSIESKSLDMTLELEKILRSFLESIDEADSFLF